MFRTLILIYIQYISLHKAYTAPNTEINSIKKIEMVYCQEGVFKILQENL